MTKRLRLKATKEFIKLYNESEKIKSDISALLSEASGYATMWVEQNFPMAYELATKEQKTIIDKLIRKSNAIKNYSFAKFIYENMDKLSDIDTKKLRFNSKTKYIETPKSGLFQSILDKFKK